MPREFEIRTLITSKKSGKQGGSRDLNYNNVAEEEAVELLRELEALKAKVSLSKIQILYRVTVTKLFLFFRC